MFVTQPLWTESPEVESGLKVPPTPTKSYRYPDSMDAGDAPNTLPPSPRSNSPYSMLHTQLPKSVSPSSASATQEIPVAAIGMFCP